MFRGLYTAWTGMANEQKRLDVISNNMANSNTVGYKDEKVASQAFDQVLGIKIRDGSQAYHNECIGSLSLGVKIGETYTDYSQGSVRQTGGTYDLALSGSGFFAVSVTDKAGEAHTRYTRDGRFHLTKCRPGTKWKYYHRPFVEKRINFGDRTDYGRRRTCRYS